jgi:hypothetical protein
MNNFVRDIIILIAMLILTYLFITGIKYILDKKLNESNNYQSKIEQKLFEYQSMLDDPNSKKFCNNLTKYNKLKPQVTINKHI